MKLKLSLLSIFCSSFLMASTPIIENNSEPLITTNVGIEHLDREYLPDETLFVFSAQSNIKKKSIQTSLKLSEDYQEYDLHVNYSLLTYNFLNTYAIGGVGYFNDTKISTNSLYGDLGLGVNFKPHERFSLDSNVMFEYLEDNMFGQGTMVFNVEPKYNVSTNKTLSLKFTTKSYDLKNNNQYDTFTAGAYYSIEF